MANPQEDHYLLFMRAEVKKAVWDSLLSAALLDSVEFSLSEAEEHNSQQPDHCILQ